MLPDTTYLEMPQGLAQQLLSFLLSLPRPVFLSPFLSNLRSCTGQGQVDLWVYSSQCPWLSAEGSRS